MQWFLTLRQILQAADQYWPSRCIARDLHKDLTIVGPRRVKFFVFYQVTSSSEQSWCLCSQMLVYIDARLYILELFSCCVDHVTSPAAIESYNNITASVRVNMSLRRDFFRGQFVRNANVLLINIQMKNWLTKLHNSPFGIKTWVVHGVRCRRRIRTDCSRFWSIRVGFESMNNKVLPSRIWVKRFNPWL